MVKVMASGGHFLPFDTLHLTEVTRWLHHTAGLSSTNAGHECALRSLARLMLYLPSIYAGELPEQVSFF